MIEFANFVIEVLFWMLVVGLALQVFGGMLNQHMERKIQELDAEIEEIKKSYKRVKIEEYHDTFYLFDADTDQFIGQGRTVQEITERVPGEVILNVIEGDPDVVQRFRQTFPQTDLV